MFLASVQPLLLGFASRVDNFSEGQISLAAVAIASATVLVSWRLWAFTIVPALYPHEPKEVPYWIPCKLFIDELKANFLNRPKVMC